MRVDTAGDSPAMNGPELVSGTLILNNAEADGRSPAPCWNPARPPFSGARRLMCPTTSCQCVMSISVMLFAKCILSIASADCGEASSSILDCRLSLLTSKADVGLKAG